MFGDQYDNFSRIHETGFGIGLEPYHFVKEEMVKAINELLANEQLKVSMEKASKRILSSQKHGQLCDLIESKLGVTS